MRLRQKYNYDCAHCCMEFLGFKRPKIRRELNGYDIIPLLGKRYKSDKDYPKRLNNDGLYLITRGKTGHWIAKKGKDVFEPCSGKITDTQTLRKMYPGWNLIYCINVKGESC